MAVIFHVLKEELQRLRETEKAYSKAISGLPRGNPRLQSRYHKKYLYLEYRDGAQVINKYIGPHESDQSKEILEKVAQRKRYEKLLEQTTAALKDVKKALRGKI